MTSYTAEHLRACACQATSSTERNSSLIERVLRTKVTSGRQMDEGIWFCAVATNAFFRLC
jgi:hypothetical protein